MASQSSTAASFEPTSGPAQQPSMPPPAASDGVNYIIPIFEPGRYVDTIHVDDEETHAVHQHGQNSSTGVDLPVTSWRQIDEKEPPYGSQLGEARVSSSAKSTVGSSRGRTESRFQDSTSSDSGRSHAGVNGAANGTHN